MGSRDGRYQPGKEMAPLIFFSLSYAVSPSGVHPREGQLLPGGQSRQQSILVAELLVGYCLFFSRAAAADKYGPAVFKRLNSISVF